MSNHPMSMPFQKYRPYETVALPDRTWPDTVIAKAPIWCSTDLRDGNQALVNPMDAGRKRRFFDLLLSLGIKEIEVGFPSASKTDFDFVRTLVDQELIPDDVTIAVLTQARPELIERSYEAIDGARRAIVHLYNSTSVTQRRVVFRMEREGITELAVSGTTLCKRLAGETSTEIVFQYSPESFHHTELDYAVEICERVAAEWGPTPAAKMIVNLPTTVEQFPPNVYADRMEWFGRHFSFRDSAILSVHPHNDRGTAVATAELGLMAGAERVEGTLFGNGERTGQRRPRHDRPEPLDAGRRSRARPVADRRGEGDRRGVQRASRSSTPSVCRRARLHGVLRLAPGRDQEGDGRAGAVGLGRLGRAVPVDRSEGRGAELRGDHPRQLPVRQGWRRLSDGGRAPSRAAARPPGRFRAPGAADHRRAWGRADGRRADGGVQRTHYLEHVRPYELVAYTHSSEEDSDQIAARVRVDGEERVIEGEGNGPLAALVDAFAKAFGVSISIRDYHEHAMAASVDAKAAAYVEADVGDEAFWGVGVHGSILTASLRAIVNAVNRAEATRTAAEQTVVPIA